MSSKYIKLLSVAVSLLFAGSTAAVTYTDNFSNAVSTLNWNALGYACLTAGSGAGAIPACAAPKETTGSGALRLTPALNSQTGAILSNFTFPLSQGLQVTFTTYTYGGDSGGTAKNGADGIAFFLTDGSFAIPKIAGGQGGSLGYSCSNSNAQYEGIPNAYLGLGIDEFGNFLNSGDNASKGISNTNYSGVTTNGTNSYKNGQQEYQPERIGLRGAGNLTWAWLQSQNPSYYTGSTPDAGKTQAACKSGTYVSAAPPKQPLVTTKIPFNYNAIDGGYSVLPNSTLIANESAKSRGAATPITYKLNISTSGLLNFAYSYNNGAFQPVLANNSITSSNGPLPAALRFGFSSGTGGSNNVHEITRFSAAPLLSNTSAGANTVQSGQVKIGSQIYLATYTTDNWWGSVVSDSLNTSSDGTLSVSTVSNWDANCDLSGGPCPSLGTNAQGAATTNVTAQPPASRVLLTSSGAVDGGSAFRPSNGVAGITARQQANLSDSGDVTGVTGVNRLNWLRGDRSNEQLQSPAPGNLRARTQVLGDIIDSSPTFVGPPAQNMYPDAFTDNLLGTTATNPENATAVQAYSAFVTSQSSRTSVVYAGSNDGFMHGFAAGPPSSDGTYNASTNNGNELLGFMPAGVLGSSGIVNLTSPSYVHNFFVDATPVASDLFYSGKWHTWLVGGVGAGGSEVYALDITDPTQFTELNAAKLVVGDWSSATTGLSHLGTTTGTPVVARLHNGNWAIIFGNGLGTTTTAGVYLGLVNSTTGAVTFQFLDTKVGSSSSPNGITYVTSVDLDGDNIADYLYAGDIQGNVWRFDLTSASPVSWVVSTFGNSGLTPLYGAKTAGTTPAVQPITTAAVVTSVAVGGGNRVMVTFGTGQKTPFTRDSGDVYASGTETFYGIWDWDMSAWNTASKMVNPNAQYVSLVGTQTFNRSALLTQTLTSTSNVTGTNSQVLGYRSLSTGTVVCWQGSSTCSSGNSQYGWLFDLPSLNEQIIYNPTLIGGAVVVNTAIPSVISASQCNAGMQSGWTMAFDPASGGGIVQSFFPNASGSTATTNGSTVGGIQLNGVGTPTSVSNNGQTYIVTQTVPGTPALSKVYPPNNPMSRVSWKEIRH